MPTLLQVLLSFIKVGALSFGGAYASVPLVEREVVSCGWMSAAEFADLMAMDELTPGPILINSATFVGMRVAGVPGAIVATLGCILPACLASLALVLLYRRYADAPPVKGTLHALKCMACGLIASTLLAMATRTLVPDGRPALLLVPVVAGAYVALRRKASPLLVILACGAAGSVLAAFGAWV
ncbi:MAG: chromate transporter [Coriobacteriales bacterium]|nr:chromate transporter [Coriobacteriales bacterium]